MEENGRSNERSKAHLSLRLPPLFPLHSVVTSISRFCSVSRLIRFSFSGIGRCTGAHGAATLQCLECSGITHARRVPYSEQTNSRIRYVPRRRPRDDRLHRLTIRRTSVSLPIEYYRPAIRTDRSFARSLLLALARSCSLLLAPARSCSRQQRLTDYTRGRGYFFLSVYSFVRRHLLSEIRDRPRPFPIRQKPPPYPGLWNARQLFHSEIFRSSETFTSYGVEGEDSFFPFPIQGSVSS